MTSFAGFLEYSGLTVDHVSNVTDIDDKIIARANEEHRPPEEIAAQYEAEWWEAMNTLGCLLPTQVHTQPPSSRRWWSSSPSSVVLGSAYETSDGVYFTVSAVDDYGLLAHQSLASLRSGDTLK